MNDPIVLIPGHDYRTSATESLQEDIIRYYDECYWDYRTSWLSGTNLAIHYGYWDTETRNHGQALLNMNRLLAETAGIRPGMRVLDAGCGIGGSAIWLAENRGVRVTGITLSELQVSQARRNAANRGVTETAEFKAADFCATPFADESFDVVWGIESICHALDKGQFAREAYRLLRKGGRLVCSDGYALRREFAVDEWETIRTCLNGWQIPNLATPDEFRSYLEQSGFQEIRYADITANILPSSKRLYRTAQLTYPMQKIMGWLKMRTPAQTGNFYTALNQYRIFSKGLACYGVFCAVK
jgi:cyclopropane fatty-acyl-phospholipid synthase-like methyltransferase